MACKPNTSGWLASGADYAIVRVTLAGQRQAGVDFDTAWALALRMVRREDRLALIETQGAWARAYNRGPFYSDASISMLADHAAEHYDQPAQLVM